MSGKSSAARANGAQHKAESHASVHAHARNGRIMADSNVRAIADALGVPIEAAERAMPDEYRQCPSWAVYPLWQSGRYDDQGVYHTGAFVRNTLGDQSGKIAVRQDFDAWQAARSLFLARLRDGRASFNASGRLVFPVGMLARHPATFVAAVQAGWLDVVLAADDQGFTRKAVRVDRELGTAHDTRSRPWDDMTHVLWTAIRAALPKEYAIWDAASRLMRLAREADRAETRPEADRPGTRAAVKAEVARQAVARQASILIDAWVVLWPSEREAATRAIDSAVAGLALIRAPWAASVALSDARVADGTLRADEQGPNVREVAGLIDSALTTA